MRLRVLLIAVLAAVALVPMGCKQKRAHTSRLGKSPSPPALRLAEQLSGEIVWRVHTGRKIAAITLDDGPDPRFTPTVLKIAKEKGIKLTFFDVGKEIKAHPDLARQELAEGHVIGNHTWDHPHLPMVSAHTEITEIDHCEREIVKICGEKTHLFRPPYGKWDSDTFIDATDEGYRIILWTVAVEHRTAKTPEAMAKRVIRKAKPGMIILLHDGELSPKGSREKSMEALPLVIDGLKKKGYEFVTIPELIADGDGAPPTR